MMEVVISRRTMSPRRPRATVAIICTLLICLSILLPPVLSLSSTASPPATRAKGPSDAQNGPHQLCGDWSSAKHSLRNPKCCVVSVPGLDHHLSILQQYFCGEDAPSDLDLRMKVRCHDGKVHNVAYEDCAKVYHAVMEPPLPAKAAFDPENVHSDESNHPCILALEELTRGVASLADGPLEGTCTDVHMRVVCASNYQAHDPMFHTDKCPLRGYVTLTGAGTQYMDETCNPWEYAALRTLGVDALGQEKAKRMKMAKELEFIVMKGDLYEAPLRWHGSRHDWEGVEQIVGVRA